MNEWINVKDRLPEENGRYLCCVPLTCQGEIIHKSLAVFDFVLNAEEDDDLKSKGVTGPAWTWFDSDYGTCATARVTHWMALPEPPEMED